MANECKDCTHYNPLPDLIDKGRCEALPLWVGVTSDHHCSLWAKADSELDKSKSGT